MNTRHIRGCENYLMDQGKSDYLEKEFYDLLRRDIKYLELLQSTSIDGFSYVNLDQGKDAWFSLSLVNLLDKSAPNTANTQHWIEDQVHPQDAEMYKNLYSIQAENPNLPSEVHIRFISADSKVVTLKLTSFTIKNSSQNNRRLTLYSKLTQAANPVSLADPFSVKSDDESNQFLFEHSRIGLGFLYADENWAKVNQELCKILEINKELLLGNPFNGIFSEIERNQSHRMFNTLCEGKYKTIVFEKKILTLTNKYKWIKVTLHLISEQLSSKYRFMVSIEDISENRLLENTLRSKEKYYRQYFDLGLVGMGFCDHKLSIKESNSKLRAIFEFNHEYINKENWLSLFTEANRRRIKQGFKSLVEGASEQYSDKLNLVTWKGSSKTISISVTLNTSQLHQEQHFILFIEDITKETKNIKEKERTLNKLRNAESIAKVGNWSYRLSDGKIECSKELWRIFGQEKIELTYKRFLAWVRPDYRDFHNHMLSQILHMKPGDRFPKFTYPIVTANGEEKWVQVFLEAKFEMGDQLSELFGVIMDISDNYKRTVAIQKLNTELTRSNAELERFAYVASHDLKAPLRAIKNLSSWIEEDIEDIATDDTKNHLSLLGNRIERMEGMLEGLLQYARVSTRSFETTTLNLEQELDDIWSLFDENTHVVFKKSLQIDQVSVPSTPFLLVLNNLISNSIKHGNSALTEIEVSAELDEENNVYRISVKDDGPGIPPRFHQKVFELFQSLKPKDEVEGSGLGLSMVQRVVQQYKGNVELHSNPDVERGTTVRFSWPYH